MIFTVIVTLREDPLSPEFIIKRITILVLGIPIRNIGHDRCWDRVQALLVAATSGHITLGGVFFILRRQPDAFLTSLLFTSKSFRHGLYDVELCIRSARPIFFGTRSNVFAARFELKQSTLKLEFQSDCRRLRS
ncbi:hypothetical protein FRACYDRAFT_257601 [Fragilariopsis cylindrus CCMP1102]|uniref:Uncharacterized protein n=1 Tax=Fragilariopsis cylindrus CCMP1102 TaxID=635003 RepID=A0A1E7EJ41_9STRA|nr:hypothetical protein FRACYDRAFT_257601 [Fragilariopsis cylindrus CCMP1102]|eukprot:OEU05890.1 hypothetical protein FRACYDRAFT_257601 [Fragilariopsis cylindrus CCMP1102]